ncbi:hypothetical protein A2U01_0094245, partial [Trifolium medium]|nr:hypothetical protein [Trifolium medium]
SGGSGGGTVTGVCLIVVVTRPGSNIEVFTVAESCGSGIATMELDFGGGDNGVGDEVEKSFWKALSNLEFHSALKTQGPP